VRLQVRVAAVAFELHRVERGCEASLLSNELPHHISHADTCEVQDVLALPKGIDAGRVIASLCVTLQKHVSFESPSAARIGAPKHQPDTSILSSFVILCLLFALPLP
jgi:hypothetical protein